MDIDYNPLVLKQNLYKIQMNRMLLSVLSGIFCGISRVEGVFNGIIMYCLWQLVGSIIMLKFAVPSGQSASLFFPSGAREIFQSQNFSGIMTFILVWTLVYDLVHIF